MTSNYRTQVFGRDAQRSNATAYFKFVVYGGLGLDTLLLGQFVTINRDVLAATIGAGDIGLTFFSYDIPTAQVIICALAFSMPCFAFLSICYSGFMYFLAYLPDILGSLLFLFGVVGLGVAVLATFWFFSFIATLVFLVCLLIMFLAASLSIISMKLSRKHQNTTP